MMGDVQRSTTETASHVQSATRQIDGLTFRLNAFGQTARSTLAAIGVSLSAIGTIRSAVTLAADAELMQSAFSTMLQSASAGAQMVQDIQTLAAETPLDTSTLSAATKQLLQFGVVAENVLPTVRMLGDVAGGDAQRLQSLALAFGQATSAGRLTGQDLLQMVNAGFNPLQEMAEHAAKTMGGTVTENMATLRAELERGHITADIMQESFRRVTSAGGRFSGAMQDAAKTTAGLYSTMMDDINSTLRTLGQDIIDGLQLKELMKQVSAAAQVVTGWLKSISPETKRILAIVGTLVTGIGALGVALVAAEVFLAPVVVMLGSMAATVGALLGPIALAAAAIAVFIDSMGGIGPAWEAVRSGAVAAWDAAREKTEEVLTWAKPIADALGGLFSAAWARIKSEATFGWDVIKVAFEDGQAALAQTWGLISADSTVTWTGIRDSIVSVVDVITFSLTNIGSVAELVWTQAKLSAVTFFNVVTHFFTDVIPTTLSWFGREWRAVFRDVFVWTGHVVTDLAANVVRVLTNIPGLISGAVDWSTVWRPLAQEFVRTSEELILPERQIGQVERQLQQQVDAQAARIARMYAEFAEQQRRARLPAPAAAEAFEPLMDLNELEPWQLDILFPPETIPQAQRHGQEVAKAVNKGIGSHLQKLDSFLVGGADDAARLAAHLDMLMEPVRRAATDAAGGPNGLLNALRPGALPVAPPIMPVMPPIAPIRPPETIVQIAERQARENAEGMAAAFEEAAREAEREANAAAALMMPSFVNPFPMGQLPGMLPNLASGVIPTLPPPTESIADIATRHAAENAAGMAAAFEEAAREAEAMEAAIAPFLTSMLPTFTMPTMPGIPGVPLMAPTGMAPAAAMDAGAVDMVPAGGNPNGGNDDQVAETNTLLRELIRAVTGRPTIELETAGLA